MPLPWVLWAEFGLVLLLSAAFLLLGVLVCRRGRWARNVVVLLGGMSVGYRVLTSIAPDRFSVNLPYLVLAGVVAPAGFLLLAAGFALPRKGSRQRVLIGVFSVVLAYYVLCDPAYLAVNGPELSRLQGRWTQDVMRQSKTFTCAPAAAATLLRAWGISVAEGKMALAARTSFRGTELPRLAEAIALYGRPRQLQVDILQLTFDDLYRLNRPAVLFVKKRGWRHSVMLLKLENGKALIGDPASGLREIAVSEFDEYYQWGGRAIVARRNDNAGPDPAGPRDPAGPPDPALH